MDFEKFLEIHRCQLESSGVPDNLWQALFHKLQNGIFDAGDYFMILKKEYENEEDDAENHVQEHEYCVSVNHVDGIDCQSNDQIFLIDHIWTYRLDKARQQLREIPGLIDTMSKLMDCDDEIEHKNNIEGKVDLILKLMWKYNLPYSMKNTSNIEDSLPIWYIMDYFGSRVPHSDSPNVRIVPFFYSLDQMTYSLLFPLKNMENETEITRDYIENVEDIKDRNVLSLPWKENIRINEIDVNPDETPKEYFTEGRSMETLPSAEHREPNIPLGRPLRVYAEYLYVKKYLTDSQFEVVDNEYEADILWLTTHFKKYFQFNELCPDKFVNQFPCEYAITVKDLMSVVARRAFEGPMIDPETLEGNLAWLPVTYNLKTELASFVSYFKKREKEGLDNHWICKPWNLARSLDMHVTDNLDHILRLPSTGPKIACKYLENAVLFLREDIGLVKFDVRYIVLLKSVDPLQVYIYDRFWLRFGNKPFSLDHLDDYEKHFTVMNYGETQLKNMFCYVFIEKLQKQYPQLEWKNIELQIGEMIKSFFKTSVAKSDYPGIVPNKQSRAVYGIDLMLKWDDNTTTGVQPMLLEVNFTPDCRRACEYYSDFYNDIFSVLFLNETEDKHVKEL